MDDGVLGRRSTLEHFAVLIAQYSPALAAYAAIKSTLGIGHHWAILVGILGIATNSLIGILRPIPAPFKVILQVSVAFACYYGYVAAWVIALFIRFISGSA